MSILPLGNSSADRPGREYQERLNNKANSPLAQSGWFKEFQGLYGMCPVQLTGTLQNGEYVYFRARGNKVELEVSATADSEPHAHYIKTLEVVDHELGTGVLPEELCVKYITAWLTDYIRRCGACNKRYCGAAFEQRDTAERITITK